MRIEEIDKNMKVETAIDEPDLVWLDAKELPFSLHGVFYDEEEGCYLRMPKNIAKTVSTGVENVNYRTAGGRVRFKTNSSVIAIRSVQKTRGLMDHITLLGQSGFDIYRKNEEGKDLYYASFRPPMGMREGYSSKCLANGKLAEYTINFPLYDNVYDLYIGLKKDAIIEAAEPYKIQKPIIYYGSSITQGGCASRPGNSYQAMLTMWLNADHINLGFSGSCKAEEEMAKYLGEVCKNASAFVCDYDHNTPSVEHLKATHLPLYRAVRNANPDLPILFMSAHNIIRTPSPYTERFEVIKETYNIAKAEGDEKVWLLPGNKLFEGLGFDSCTVDGIHPNDLGFFRMAAAIEPYLKEMLNL